MLLTSAVMAENNIVYFISGGVIVLLILIIALSNATKPITIKVEKKIKKKKYISKEDFFKSWERDKSDYPGCYVILIYDKKLIINPMNYDEIYVGQSVNVRKRIFNHLMGHGNGDVYYGLKSGCRVYIVIQKCSKKKLNENEIDLIEYFEATDSLNVTKGGSTKR